MNILLKKVNTEYNKKLIIITIIALAYFVFLFKYYFIDYYVHDFSYYNWFYEMGLPANDGFSSMFLSICRFITTHPKKLTVFCLLLLTLSIWNISLTAINYLKKLWKVVAFEVLLMSCGAWYYFYGKLFYDFPFTAYTYSLCFLLWGQIIEKPNNKNRNILLASFSFLEGFCLSWKPYNVFCVAGFLFLMLVEKKYRKFILDIIKNILNIISYLSLFVIGYLCGNYKIFSDFDGTIRGIRAYGARTNFKQFLFNNGTIFEIDFTGHLSFNNCTFGIITCCFILFIFPLILKKWNYLILSVVMTILFYLYITYFSPGYSWHGFTFALFVINYAYCLLLNVHEVNMPEIFKGGVSASLLLAILIEQSVLTFILYIPREIHWFTITQTAICELEDSASSITEFLNEYNDLMNSENHMFTVWIPPKRAKLINSNGIYLDYDKMQFVDPVSYKLFINGKGLFRGWWEPSLDEVINATKDTYTNYCDYFSGEPYDFVLFIVPKSLEQLYQQENLEKTAVSGFNMCEYIDKGNYNIYIYSTR